MPSAIVRTASLVPDDTPLPIIGLSSPGRYEIGLNAGFGMGGPISGFLNEKGGGAGVGAGGGDGMSGKGGRSCSEAGGVTGAVGGACEPSHSRLR